MMRFDDFLRALGKGAVRRGGADAVLKSMDSFAAAPAHPVHHGFIAFAPGLAHLRLGAPDSAKVYLARVDSLAVHTPPGVRH